MNIFFVGMMGSGKTSIGKKLANSLGMQFVDMDSYIEDKERKSVSDIFRVSGESHFRLLEHKYLLEVLSFTSTVVSTGGGLPCYLDNMDLINKNARSIYLKASPAFLKSRLVNNKKSRPLIADLDEDELLQYLTNMLEQRRETYESAILHISALDFKMEELLKSLKK